MPKGFFILKGGKEMAELPEIGKISPEIFDELIFPRLGKKTKDVLVGPQNGVDIGVVDLGNGKVMATTTDVRIVDIIPSQINPVTYNPNGGSVGGGQIVWTIPNVPVGGSGCVTWAGRVNWP